MNKIIVAGNWKMNTTLPESIRLINEIKPLAATNLEVMIFPPFTSISAVSKELEDSHIKCGAQTISEYDNGAYTGEISAEMLQAAGASLTLIGHSERRHIFNESDDTINRKVKHALNHQFTVMMCIGETLDQRENNQTETVLRDQLVKGLSGVSNLTHIIIAYEPVWAIGTGVTASPDQAENAHQFIKNQLKEQYPNEDCPSILYGGSVNASNIAELIEQPHINGVLVGGASLKSDTFGEIIHICATQPINH